MKNSPHIDHDRPARMQLISGFVDSYLKLNELEHRAFVEQIAKIKSEDKEEVMQIVTSWMEEGIEIGRKQGLEQSLEQGLRQGWMRSLLHQLTRRFGTLELKIEEQIAQLTLTQLELLSLAILDFASLADLTTWLAEINEKSEQPESDRDTKQ